MCGIYPYLEITVAIKYDSDYEMLADVQPVMDSVMGSVGVSTIRKPSEFLRVLLEYSRVRKNGTINQRTAGDAHVTGGWFDDFGVLENQG